MCQCKDLDRQRAIHQKDSEQTLRHNDHLRQPTNGTPDLHANEPNEPQSEDHVPSRDEGMFYKFICYLHILTDTAIRAHKYMHIWL